MQVKWIAITCIAAAFVGCGDLKIGEKTGTAPADKQKAQQPIMPNAVLPGGVVLPDSIEQAPGTERVEAKAGVGKQGQALNQPHMDQPLTQPLVVPLRTKVLVEQRLVFDVQIRQALDLYKATNGDFPKTHEEFMREIIDANQIKLPELPAGQRYVWVPETEKLMVERPAAGG